jgi:hypothetical protein
MAAEVAAFNSGGGTSSQAALRKLSTGMIGDFRGQMRQRDYARQLLNVVSAGLSYRAAPPINQTPEALAAWAKSLPPDVFFGQPLQAALQTPPGQTTPTELLLGCDGPPPLPRHSFLLNGQDLSSQPVQRDFHIRVLTADSQEQ